jgi:[NiFe] hydrogenase diaphorase moiety large subunit
MDRRSPADPADDCASLVDVLLERHGRSPERLVQLLRELQADACWLPRPALARIAQGLGLPFAHVEGVAGAYRFLHLSPSARWDILVSDNVTDRMLGSAELAGELCAALGVTPGRTRGDGHVRVAFTSCTGLGDQGPALLVNHAHVVTRLDASRVTGLTQRIGGDAPVASWPAEWFRVEPGVRRAVALLAMPPARGAALEAAFARGVDGLLAELESGGLRGRGGAGFPVVAKWRHGRAAAGPARAIVCNADEGEPGTFKDRVLLQLHAAEVIDGMTLAAWVVGAAHGFLYLRGEYPFLRAPLEAELARRRRDGLLGPGLNRRAGIAFDIEIHMGAGSYVCGEETALLESLEGRRGIPRIRPPFPAERGWRGLPTIVNNVETFAAAARIALHGGAWWRGLGTAETGGTLLHAVSGDVERPGVYELPGGARVAELLEASGAHDVQAVQVGGPSGTCLAPAEFDRRLGFEDVPTAGAFMVFGPDRDMVDVARRFAHFFAHESCGFCTPCRVGTKLVARHLDAVADGRASRHDLAELADLDALLRTGSHCRLGTTATLPVRDTLARFRPQYERRLRDADDAPAFDLDRALAGRTP